MNLEYRCPQIKRGKNKLTSTFTGLILSHPIRYTEVSGLANSLKNRGSTL